MGGRTPEELEMLLEDASVVRDTDALGRLFVEGALLVRGDSAARGLDAVVRLIPSTWEAGHTHLAGEGQVLQAGDLALAVGRDRISVMRRGQDRRWRYAIVLEREQGMSDAAGPVRQRDQGRDPAWLGPKPRP
jgi:ketosteroid isomerase-like protein